MLERAAFPSFRRRPAACPAAAPPVAALALALALAACGTGHSGPPDLVLDRTACDHCGMLISEPGFAAAYRSGGVIRTFDDIGCLLAAMEEEGVAGSAPGRSPAGAEENGSTMAIWVLADDMRWLDASRAFFVRSPALETPMSGGIKALADRAAAEALAASVRGTVHASWGELREATRAGADREGGSHDASG